MTECDFGHTLAIVKACEMLNFADTPKNLVILTETGNRFLDGDINSRKTIFREQLKTLGTFRFLTRILGESLSHKLPSEVVQEELIVRMPTQDAEKSLATVLTWGRFAELLGYSAETGMIYLDQP